MNTKETEILVIGAGPAGLLATDRLARHGVDVTLVDAGRHHARRVCPVDRLRSCHGCRGICNVISGFGGSIHYGDGVKLSKFPSGRRLAEMLGAERSHQLSEEALEYLCGANPPTFRGAQPGDIPFDVKDYPVASLTSAQVHDIVDGLYERLSANPHVTLRLATEITDLRPDEQGGFTARLGSSGSEEQITASRVIAAVGRRGQRWWAGKIRELGIGFVPPAPSVGLRFEAPTDLLIPGSAVHDDFKTTMVRHGVKVKTFCFCASTRWGTHQVHRLR